jgi:DNA polymerase III alpha subunit
MLFGRISDYTGSAELVVFPKTLKELPTVFKPGTCIMLRGSFNTRNGEASFVVDKAKSLG